MNEQDALVWEGEQVVTVREFRFLSPSGLGAGGHRVRRNLWQRSAHRRR
jgi:hypothetical protein